MYLMRMVKVGQTTMGMVLISISLINIKFLYKYVSMLPTVNVLNLYIIKNGYLVKIVKY